MRALRYLIRILSWMLVSTVVKWFQLKAKRDELRRREKERRRMAAVDARREQERRAALERTNNRIRRRG